MRMACDLDERSLKSVARLFRFTFASRTSLSRCAWEDTGARREQGAECRRVSMAAFGLLVRDGPRLDRAHLADPEGVSATREGVRGLVRPLTGRSTHS